MAFLMAPNVGAQGRAAKRGDEGHGAQQPHHEETKPAGGASCLSKPRVKQAKGHKQAKGQVLQLNIRPAALSYSLTLLFTSSLSESER